MSSQIKITLLVAIALFIGLLIAHYFGGPTPVGVLQEGPLPASTPLQPTPRKLFMPTKRNGHWNIDIVDDFTLPLSKSLTFSGAGRNLHVQQDWSKLFRRGFTSIDKTRMVPEEYRDEMSPKPVGWQSRLKPEQRALTIGQGYLIGPFELAWGGNSELATETWFQRPHGDPRYRQCLYQAMMEIEGGCENFGDCPPNKRWATYGKIFLDIENEGISFLGRQEQVNLYVYMMKALKDHVSPITKIGSIAPIPNNGFGYAHKRDYEKPANWLWAMPAKMTPSSQRRGMPADIVGKSFADYADFQMPGCYFLYGDFDYTLSHTNEQDRHWLANLLQEQEVNATLSTKNRIAWQWLFNTTSSGLPDKWQKTYPSPPTISEGTAIFYWFTGAQGAILWDDASDLAPGKDGFNRNYSTYEHYLEGLWRLFKHHGDFFNGREKYLNDQTECSYDSGKTWYKYNASQLKSQGLPFVRAIINKNEILVAATHPYAPPNQTCSVMLRYIQNGYQFYTTIHLKGDEIFLGRASMRER